jgi:hypothetical protein
MLEGFSCHLIFLKIERKNGHSPWFMNSKSVHYAHSGMIFLDKNLDKCKQGPLANWICKSVCSFIIGRYKHIDTGTLR